MDLRRWYSSHPAWTLAGGLLFIAILVYVHTIPYPFVWDDEGLVTRNPHVRSLTNVFALFNQDLYWGKGGNTYYRPIQAIFDTIDYAFYGLQSFGYHLTNILLHAIVGVLLFHLFHLLTGRLYVSFIAAAIWLVHPVQPEAVTYIAGRADSLSAMFVLGTILLHLRAEKEINPSRMWLARSLSWCSFAAAMWSKEIAFVAVPLLIWVDLWRDRRLNWRKLGVSLIPYVIVVIAYTAARAHVLPSLFGAEDEIPQEGHPLGVLAFPLGLLYGLRLLIYPYPLYMERLAPGLGSDGVPISFVCLVTCLTAGAYLWRTRAKHYEAILGCGFYLLAFLPLFILFRMNRLYLEHWLYLPSFGIIFAATFEISNLQFRGLKERALQEGKLVLAATAFLLFVLLTVNQNRVWSDPVVLYRHVLSYSPWSRRTHYNLGLAYFDLGLLEEADKEYEEARKIFASPALDGSIALLRAAQKKPDDALKAFDEVLKKDPNQPIYLNNRASVYYAKGKKKEALADIEKAISLDPGYRDGWYNLGVVSKDMGDTKRSKEAFEKVASIQIDGQVAVELAQIYMAEKEIAKAFSILERAVQADPHSAAAINYLGVLYAQSQNYGQALATWQKGLAQHPDDVNLRTNMAHLEELMRGQH